ncbi:MbcA/ParS/Xre antitoxin family protein [Sphingomonas sp.]|jgi:hypothetical protein|uniref:MbcA/ParS/Xre antitoxin family protein n=1 Tax=Sphingomonas sp. TaxID=28214 RepID=UPI002E2F2B48|nr:MbcA/ParS/Xre antitoxin family protein [Sphingomonas sp.]HEX4694468.1 MbcA/ParS/Xre antitoxin family protein [Sphingomonas sp.]
MIEGVVEADHAARRCGGALDDWGLDETERWTVKTGGISSEEPGGAVALETRQRHIVDVDRSMAMLVGRASLVPVWLRLPQDALDGLTPLELMTSHVAGLSHVRRLLVRERLERGFH